MAAQRVGLVSQMSVDRRIRFEYATRRRFFFNPNVWTGPDSSYQTNRNPTPATTIANLHQEGPSPSRGSYDHPLE